MCYKLRKPSDSEKEPEVFQCPRIFEEGKKSWCCGMNTQDPHCCEWSAKEQELGISGWQSFFYGSGGPFFVVVGFIVVLTLAIVAVCWTRKRSRYLQRLQNTYDPPTGYPHHPGAPPMGAFPPPVPPYTEYPNQAAYPPQVIFKIGLSN